jgi:hypothetical protein
MTDSWEERLVIFLIVLAIVCITVFGIIFYPQILVGFILAFMVGVIFIMACLWVYYG